MTDESSESAPEENPKVLSRRQVLGGAAGTTAVSGVGGFLLGSYTGNPLWDNADEGPYPPESTSGFSLIGTAAPQDFPVDIDISFDEDVIQWDGYYWADDISRSLVGLPGQNDYQFIHGGGYSAWIEFYSRHAYGMEEPYSTRSFIDTRTTQRHFNDFEKIIIYLSLGRNHIPTIEINIQDDHSNFHGAEFWFSGIGTNPRISVGIVRPP